MDANLNQRILAKVPPRDLQSEMAALGAAMLSEEALTYLVGALSADDFYEKKHRVTFLLLQELFKNSRTVDYVVLCSELDARGQLEAAGGADYLSECTNLAVASNYRDYCKLILNKSMLRRLIGSLETVLNHCYGDSAAIDNLIDMAAKELYDIRQHRDERGFVAIKDILSEQIENWRLARESGQSQSIPSGFPALDYALGGLHKGALIIVAARPGMGKSAFALNIAHKAAFYHQVPVAIFSLEMSRYEIGNRFLAAQTDVDLQSLSAQVVKDEVIHKASEGLKELRDLPIYVNDITGVTPIDMLSRCRQLQLLHKQRTGQDLGLIIVDYLQLMQSGRKNSDNRQQEISDISRQLKIMARELNVPVIALSQLSRAAEGRTNKRPMLSDLRDSGAIEQDADVVLFLYREQYYDQNENPDLPPPEIEEAELHIAKNRHGSTRVLQLNWMPKRTLFFEEISEHAVGDAPPF